MKTNESRLRYTLHARQMLLGAFSLLAFGLVFSLPARAQDNVWVLDQAHTLSRFTVRHLMISNVRGGFTKTTGTVQYDPADPSKTVIQATIDTTTLDSGVDGRDKDLRTNYLEVDKFPTITFQSKRVEAAGSGNLNVTGDLTIHGVTKEVVLNVTDITPPVKNNGVTHIGAEASTKISRKDFGITRNVLMEGGGAIVGDEVDITIDIDTRQPPPAAPAAKPAS